MAELDLEPHLERMRKKIGEEHGPFVMAVEKGALIKFSKSIGETNPIYFDEEYAKKTRFGGLIAPPTFVSCYITDLSADMYDFETPGLRSLHTDDIVQSFLPIRVGDVISATCRYVDVSTRPGRNGPMLFQATDTTLTNQKGERVAVVRMIVASFV